MDGPTMEQYSLQQCWMTTRSKVSDLHHPIAWIWDGGTPAAARDVAPPARMEWPPIERGKNTCNLDKNQDQEGTEPSERSHKWGNRGNGESRDLRSLRKTANGSGAVVLFWMTTWSPSNIEWVLDWGMMKEKEVESRQTSCLHDILDADRREEVSGCRAPLSVASQRSPQGAWWGTRGCHESRALEDDCRHVWDHLE